MTLLELYERYVPADEWRWVSIKGVEVHYTAQANDRNNKTGWYPVLEIRNISHGLGSAQIALKIVEGGGRLLVDSHLPVRTIGEVSIQVFPPTYW